MRALLFAITTVLVVSTEAYQTQLVRKESTRQRLLRQGGDAYAQQVQKKNEQRIRVKLDVQAGFPQQVNDYDDHEYVGNITIGTPPQTFTMMFDAITANMWVPDAICGGAGDCGDVCDDPFLCPLLCSQGCCDDTARQPRLVKKTQNKNAACKNKRKYESSKSSTFVRDGRAFSIDYGYADCEGLLGLDTVALGGIGTNQLVIPSVTFGQAHGIAEYFTSKHYDGVMGLAFQSTAVHFVKPVFQEAIDQKLVKLPLFTVFLEHEKTLENVPGGVYTWGDIDSVNCGPVIGFVPLSSATYFKFQMKGLSMGTFSSNEKYEAASAAGTPYIVAPSSVVEKLATVAGATYRQDWELYTIDCSAKIADLAVTIGSFQLSLNAENMIIPGDAQSCVFAVKSLDSFGFEPDFFLGDPFVRQYCNIYDVGNKRMGFAKSLQKN